VATRAYDQPDNDFHDFMFLPDGKLMIALGTVHLTGVNALISHASIRAILRNAALCEFSPAEALELTNTLIFPDLEEGQVVDCLYAILDPPAGHFSYAAAGMKFLMFSEQRQRSLIDNPGPPLGKSLSSQYSSKSISIDVGSRLLLLTNGLFRSPNGEGKTIDPQIIRNQLDKEDTPLPSITDNILYIYRDFVKDTLKQAEDITSIALEHAIVVPEPHTTGRARVVQNFRHPKAQRDGE
jgi:serine phosphatase RsbU (regulator of sigma subunit)